MVTMPDDDRYDKQPDTAMTELDTYYIDEFKQIKLDHSSEKSTEELEELKKKKRRKKSK
jgi:hypothetical protein